MFLKSFSKSRRSRPQSISDFQNKNASLINEYVEKFQSGKFPEFSVSEKVGGFYQEDSKIKQFSRFSKWRSKWRSWQNRHLVFGRVQNSFTYLYGIHYTVHVYRIPVTVQFCQISKFVLKNQPKPQGNICICYEILNSGLRIWIFCFI